MRNSSCLVVLVVALLLTSKASASTDINGLFDARSHAMGGTGVAYIDSAGGITINPALLDQVKKLSLIVDVFGISAQPTAPYTIYHLNEDGSHYTNFESIRSKRSFAALPSFGVAYRLHKRLVLGLATGPIIGQGTSAKYYPAPDELPNTVATNKAAMGLIEVNEGLSIKVLENLSIAFAWRLTYMTQSVNLPTPTGLPPTGTLLDRSDPTTPQVSNADQKITGINFYGFQFGAFYKITPKLNLGFSYRNRVDVWGKDGMTTAKVAGQTIKIPTQGGFNNPHSVRGGLAWTTLGSKLLLAGDFKYLFYKSAWETTKQIRTQEGKPPETSYTPTYWKNSWVVQLGIEYKAADFLAVRAGYTVLQSATNPDYGVAFMAPAGISHLATAGLGFKVHENVNIDTAAGFVILKSQINTATYDDAGKPLNAGVGEYSSKGGEFSIAASYHL